MDLLDELVPRVCKRDTVRNVKRFLKKEFVRIERMSTISATQLKSPSFDGVGGGSNAFDNSFRDQVEHDLDNRYDDFMIAMHVATRKMNEPCRTIFRMRAFTDATWYQVEMDTGYGRTKATELFEDACLQFADYFCETVDFRVYE